MTTDILVHSPASIIARVERLPVSRWHTRVRIILGTATFFDAFDALSIAFVLPALIGLWHLHPAEIGLLISGGYAGQVLGAIVFGWVGERFGRIRALNSTILILALFGLACAFSSSYGMLLVFRILQGIGLGGENPVAATYVNEIAKAQERGRFVLLYQLLFPFGFMLASVTSLLVVPHFGWRWMFIIGALPAILVIPLRRLVPESPRWLARHGRLEEADRILTAIESEVAEGGAYLPSLSEGLRREAEESADFRSLFRGMYLSRTLSMWLMWACSGAISYGLQTWLPTILKSVYKLSINRTLEYSAISYVLLFAVAVAAALLIDRVGRRPMFLFSFAIGAIMLGWLWLIADTGNGLFILVLASLTTTFNSIVQLSFWLFAPEIYPTRMRALGTGSAGACARIAAMVTPVLVGVTMQSAGIAAVFFMLTLVAIIGFVTVYFFAIETKGQSLEKISP